MFLIVVTTRRISSIHLVYDRLWASNYTAHGPVYTDVIFHCIVLCSTVSHATSLLINCVHITISMDMMTKGLKLIHLNTRFFFS